VSGAMKARRRWRKASSWRGGRARSKERGATKKQGTVHLCSAPKLGGASVFSGSRPGQENTDQRKKRLEGRKTNICLGPTSTRDREGKVVSVLHVAGGKEAAATDGGLVDGEKKK